MSRHSLQPRADQRHIYEIAIGWDRSLRTFFVIIFGTPVDDDDECLGQGGGAPSDELLPLLWAGTAPAALTTPAAAIALAAPYAQIPDTLEVLLEADRVREGSSVIGPVQRSWLQAIWPGRISKGRP
jgi:hypothetical protein